MGYIKEAGIYAVTCTVNNKKYIGQSTSLRSRLYMQKYHLNKNSSHHPLLQSDWNLFKSDCFTMEVLEYTSNLDEREKYWIEYYDSFSNGYNTTTGGVSGNKQDDRQKAIRSERIKGEKNPMYGIGKGEGNPNAKLTEIEVIGIKTMLKNGCKAREINKVYDLTRYQLYNIRHNKSWSHIEV